MPTDQEFAVLLDTIRQNPKPTYNGDNYLLTEALKVPEADIQAWLSILTADDKLFLSYEIKAMDASIRCFDAMETAQGVMSSNSKKLASQREEIVQLQASLEEKEQIITEKDAANGKETQALQENIAGLRADLSDKNHTIATRLAKINLSETQAANYKEELESTQAQLSAKTQEAFVAQQNVAALQASLLAKDHALAEKDAKISDLRESVLKLQEEGETQSKIVRAKDGDINKKAEIVVLRESEIKELKAQVQKLSAEAARAKDVISGLHSLARKPEAAKQ